MNFTEIDRRGLNQKIFKDLKTQTERLLSFLVVSSFFLSINSSLKLYFSFLLFDLKPVSNFILATFFVTFSIYSLNRITDKEEDAINMPERSAYIKDNELLVLILIIFSYGFAIVLGLWISILSMPILLVPLFSGIVYSVKIFSGVRLKDIPVVKSIIVSLCWAIGAAFLPPIDSGKSFIFISSVFYFFFLKSFINTVLFDVRDVEGDSKNGTRTIPILIGIPKTRLLLLILQSLLVLELIISLKLGFFLKYAPILLFSMFYGYSYILFFCNEGFWRKRKFSLDLIVDGEWIPIALLTIIM
ncbi:MAG: UbiA family prenyltransferase [Halobacteriota archaeon]|nr:UbiA family prenyltransferase [Halobacteriota archaeon]